jgi:hypothetical protein
VKRDRHFDTPKFLKPAGSPVLIVAGICHCFMLFSLFPLAAFVFLTHFKLLFPVWPNFA